MLAPRRAVVAATGKHQLDLPPPVPVQKLEIQLLLLGGLAKAIGDPDWAVVTELARGVPVGLGVDLPRTPDVFPE